MKNSFLILIFSYSFLSTYSQPSQVKVSTDSASISNKVEFYIYEGPYGDKENIKEPALRFILTVKNKGIKPIPDLGVTNRTKYMNLLINDSVQNPVSMYNGSEVTGDHLLKKNATDTYTWWLFEKDVSSKVFTVQWQYMGIYSKKIKVNMPNKTSVILL